jgi:hypothetical protein
VSEQIKVENYSGVVHRFEHLPTSVVYVWPAGETREVPHTHMPQPSQSPLRKPYGGPAKSGRAGIYSPPLLAADRRRLPMRGQARELRKRSRAGITTGDEKRI